MTLRMMELSMELKDAARHSSTLGEVKGTVTMDEGVTEIEVHLAGDDPRVFHIWMNDGQVEVIEWASLYTKTVMGEASFNGFDAYVIAKFIEHAAER